MTKSQKLTGVVKETKWEDPLATGKIEVAGKVLDVVLGPPVRLDFRGLGVDDVTPGTMVTIQAVPSKQTPNEFRGEVLTIGRTETDLR
jgi:hypothetical protein